MKDWVAAGAALVLVLVLFTGCGKSSVEKALESDANGYYCGACQAKFYTDREVFADFCPRCKGQQVEQVMGYVCATDKAVTLGPRGRGARRCEKCGGTTSTLSIPREAELKAWGAEKKSRKEVCGS